MGYLTDEQQAEEALEWWQRYPDSIEALVSLSDDTASDEHGNVIGHVEWQHHPALKIMLAGSNGLVYSTRHAKRDGGWHKFYVIDAEKETQRIFKRRLQAKNKATKINTQSNETGTTDMTYGEKRDYKKIDIFVKGKYVASTTWAKTCKIAKTKYAESNNIDVSSVKAFFSK